MRKDPTPSERKFWAWLRGKRFCGLKFRRQQPVGPFIVDYYCAKARVILELEGESHVGKERYDSRRANWLAEQGIVVLRVKDIEVFNNMSAVLGQIERCVLERLSGQ